MGWSRREAEVPVNTSSQTSLLGRIQSLNPFADSGSVRLPTQDGPGAPLPAATRREEEEGFFARELWLARFPSIVLRFPFPPSLEQLHRASPACIHLHSP